MKASEIMKSPVHVIAPTDTIAHARNLMLKHKISRCPVLKDGVLKGIITKKDLMYRLRQTEPVWRRRPIDNIPVEVVMVSDPITISQDTKIREIASVMIENEISGLPVVENNEVMGIVTKSDLLTSDAIKQLDLKVSDLLHPVETVSRYHSLDHVLDIVSEDDSRVIVMNNDGTLAGIITPNNVAFFTYMNDKTELPEKDVTFLRRETSAGRKMFRDVMEVSAIAEDLMSRPVITIGPGAPIKDVVKLMHEHHIASVVVAEENELRGIVKRDDIIQEVTT